ncbi:hypothetical protein O3P69_018597 [Scylla paramamosain]|uniref:Uncharacterized protein n=1 Tax=Scylla paramamosain TaxID=85552 RepID=A0AAW0T299_SCYPA
MERNTQEEKEESEESDLEEMTFMWSEEPIVDIYEVEGRPHQYCLLREVTRQLGVSRRDLIVAAKTIETLMVSPEEFESRVYSCVCGTSRWQPDGGRVELVRLTAALERLLGLQTVAVRDYFYLDVLARRGRGVGGGRASAMGRRGEAGPCRWCERLLLCTNDAYHRLAVVYITSLGVALDGRVPIGASHGIRWGIAGVPSSAASTTTTTTRVTDRLGDTENDRL